MALLKTFTEVAEYLGCSEKSLRRAVIQGDLNVVRFATTSRSDLIHPDDLVDYLERLRQRGQTTCQKKINQSRPEEIHSTLTFRTKEKTLDQLLATKSGKKTWLTQPIYKKEKS